MPIDFVNDNVAWGPSPRASQALMLGARARALLQGRLSPSLDDVAALLGPVFRHRMALNFTARADGHTIDSTIAHLAEAPRLTRWHEAATALAFTDRAEAAARVLPPLLVEAERIAATVILGDHGRKRAGPGESFWQYRPYSFGDSTQRIDWHKSARSDRVYIRENEWEAANTLWLWASPHVSMDFKSHLSSVTKRDRARLITLAMACTGGPGT